MSAPKPPTPEYMSSAHSMDYTILHCGHPAVSQHVVTLADMSVTVHGLDEIKGSSLPVAIIVSCKQCEGRIQTGDPADSGGVASGARLRRQRQEHGPHGHRAAGGDWPVREGERARCWRWEESAGCDCRDLRTLEGGIGTAGRKGKGVADGDG